MISRLSPQLKLIRKISLVYSLFLSFHSSSNMTLLNEAKKKAAYQAVDDFVKDGMKLGIGSGSTIVFAVDRLVERVIKEGIKVVCIPTSFQANQLIINNGLVLGNLQSCSELDVTIDGADEVNPELVLIKGGGGCQTQEKIVASCAKKLVIIADYTKDSKYLGEQYKRGIPIEVLPLAFSPVTNKIIQKFGGSLDLRMAKMKAGPVISDNGNFILDWNFPQDIKDWRLVNRDIKMIPGVVETGLFVDMADAVYFGLPDGSVKIINKLDL